MQPANFALRAEKSQIEGYLLLGLWSITLKKEPFQDFHSILSHSIWTFDIIQYITLDLFANSKGKPYCGRAAQPQLVHPFSFPTQLTEAH